MHSYECISAAKSSSNHGNHHCQLAPVANATGFLAIHLVKFERNTQVIVSYVWRTVQLIKMPLSMNPNNVS